MQITPIDQPGYEKVARAEDPQSGLKAFIAVHDTTLGPALGGLRLWPYVSEEEALTDVLRLSRGMTFKSAVAKTGLGGGKSVIIADPAMKTQQLFESMGQFVESFNGLYTTAEDVNVGIDDLMHVRSQTQYVTGLSRADGGSGNPSPYTARGCYAGLKATAAAAFGSSSLDGKIIVIQGVGSVGYVLGQLAKEEGARLLVSDINEDNVGRAVKDLGAEEVSSAAVYDVDCDIFAPCALGAILNDETIPRLKCRAVAGAANNQLHDETRHAELLKERGILYAPDYVINAGGIINVSVEFDEGGYDEERALAKIGNIDDALTEIYATARDRDITTHQAAQDVAEANLLAGAVTH